MSDSQDYNIDLSVQGDQLEVVEVEVSDIVAREANSIDVDYPNICTYSF